MFVFLLVIHILVAGLMVAAILLQSGQAGGLSGAFGGGGGGGSGNQSLFGGRGAATFIAKATSYLGAAFLIVSLLLAYVQAHRSSPTSQGRNIIQEQVGQQAAPPGMPSPGSPAEGLGGAGESVPPAGAPQGSMAPEGTPSDASSDAAGTDEPAASGTLTP